MDRRASRKLGVVIVGIVAALTFVAAAGATPTNTAPPNLSGGSGTPLSAMIGTTLSSDTGSWSSGSSLNYATQWERCSYVNAVEDAGGGPIAYYRMDESSGTTAVDSSSLGNDGSYTGTPSLNWTGALNTDSDSGVYLNSAGLSGVGTSATNPLTVEGWIDPTTFIPGSAETLFGGVNFAQHTSWSLSVSATNASSAKLVLDVGTPDTSSGSITAGQWTFVAAVDTGTTQSIYINGALDSTFTSTSTRPTSGTTIGYTRTQLGGTAYFGGGFDDAAIYSTALTASDISGQYGAATSVTSGAGCEDILGATNSTYTVAAPDVGSVVRSEVTAFNGTDGTAVADSTPVTVAGAAVPLPPATQNDSYGPVIDSGVVTDASGSPIAGATVSLYANPGTSSVLRRFAIATTTTASDGSYQIVEQNQDLIAQLASSSGWVNLTRDVVGNGYWLESAISRNYDASDGTWLDATGTSQPGSWLDYNGPVTATTTVLDPAQPHVIHANGGPCGVILKSKYGSPTMGETVLAQVHAAGNGESVQFTYGSTADTTAGVSYSPNGTNNWTISATDSVHVSNSATAQAPTYGPSYSKYERGQFNYQRYKKTGRCINTTYDVELDKWTGGIDAGSSISGTDGHCLDAAYSAKHAYWNGGPKSSFTHNSSKNATFSGAVSVFGASLWAQSGYSTNVQLQWTFPTSGVKYWLCGTNDTPSYAAIVYAGPNQ